MDLVYGNVLPENIIGSQNKKKTSIEMLTIVPN